MVSKCAISELMCPVLGRDVWFFTTEGRWSLSKQHLSDLSTPNILHVWPLAGHSLKPMFCDAYTTAWRCYGPGCHPGKRLLPPMCTPIVRWLAHRDYSTASLTLPQIVLLVNYFRTRGLSNQSQTLLALFTQPITRRSVPAALEPFCVVMSTNQPPILVQSQPAARYRRFSRCPGRQLVLGLSWPFGGREW